MGRKGGGLRPPPVRSSPFVQPDDDPEHDDEHGQAAQTDAEDEHDPFIHDPPPDTPERLQASSVFVSAQVSMVARIASSLYEVTRTCSRLKVT